MARGDIAQRDALDAALARLAEPETRVDAVPVMSTDEGDEAIVDALMRRATNGAAARPLTREPTAAERWRAVPDHAREHLARDLAHRAECADGGAYAMRDPAAAASYADLAGAWRALLALAREAEGSKP